MPRSIITVDLNKGPSEQPTPVHNRWHPDIPPVAQVKPNDVFRVECLDWLGGQISDNDSVDDVKNLDFSRFAGHFLSGPVRVETAAPGDLLVVDILDIGPLREAEWGYTGIFEKSNGLGFLTDHFPNAAKAIWHFEGIYAVSRHIPGVRIAGMIHPGVLGCAPSHELLKQWNDREAALVASSTRVPPPASLPTATGAILGKLPTDNEKWAKVAGEAAKTLPPRENGGNCDIKNLSKGSRVFLPVFVDGANLSVGDIHFSQGDGEISFCGGIEMAGWVDMKVSVLKGGMTLYNTISPIFIPGPVGPTYTNHLIFEGTSVDENGKQHFLDANVAYRQACLKAIDYLSKFGYTREQAYLLLSVIPFDGRISSIVDIPNACCTVALPTDVFEFDIRPNKDGPKKHVH